MHFHSCKENQGSESPPFCTALHWRPTHVHHEQSGYSQLFCICRAFLGEMAANNPRVTITSLLQWRPGKGLRHLRTAMPDPDRSARGQGSLNATSSSPRPLALVPPVFRKTWHGALEWRPPKVLANILCYTMEVAELLREISRASCSNHGAV